MPPSAHPTPSGQWEKEDSEQTQTRGVSAHWNQTHVHSPRNVDDQGDSLRVLAGKHQHDISPLRVTHHPHHSLATVQLHVIDLWHTTDRGQGTPLGVPEKQACTERGL